MKYLFLGGYLLWTVVGLGQQKKLPLIDLDRRANTTYVDSLIQIGKENLQAVSVLPNSPTNDISRLEALDYLSVMYRYRSGKRDSVLHYANKLIEVAIQTKQPSYEIKGHYYKVIHYQINLLNYPKALQACHHGLIAIDKYPALQKESWRFYTTMGEIFIAIEQFQKALDVLNKAKLALEDDNPVKNNRFVYANVLQQIGNIYKHIYQFDNAKKYLLESLALIKPTQSKGSLYYLNLDLADLHRINGYYQEALQYIFEAEKAAYPDRLRLLNTWAWFSRVYCDLNNYDLAIEYGLKSYQKGATAMTQRIGHHSLYRAYQAKQDWQKSLLHYEKHISVSDTMRAKRQITESTNLQNDFELNQLALRSQQAQEIQAQKLLTLQKQAEIERLKAQATNDALSAQANEAELQRKLETQALKTQAQRVKLTQDQKIKELEIRELNQNLALQQRTQNFLWLGFGLLGLVVVGGVWYNRQLKIKNKQLATKNQEISEALLRGQTTERKRVAAELHDNLGGLLGALKMTTNALDTSTLHPHEQSIYRQIITMIDDANVQVRTLSHNLIPEELEKQGLVASLQKLVSKLNVGSKTKFEFQASGIDKRLEKQVEFNLYTIVLELCNNILKHANASEASVELHQQNGSLHLLVSDDGQGFDAQSDAKRGMGLHNLQARAEAIGAILKIHSQKGEGTLVSVKT